VGGGKKNVKIIIFKILVFNQVAKKIEGWFKICTSYLLYFKIWLNLPRLNFPLSSSHGWFSLLLHQKKFLKKSLVCYYGTYLPTSNPLALTIVLIIYMLPIDGCCTWFTLAMQSCGGFIYLGQRKRNVVGVSLVLSIVEKQFLGLRIPCSLWMTLL
jgi:hypothetical protein